MIENILLASITLLTALTIQCLVLALLMKGLFYLEMKGMIKSNLAGMTSLLVGVTLIILTGILMQMTLWAGLFLTCGEFNHFDVAFYHSVVNFTSLGYGDLVMSEERRLLGSLEAVNGLMMFGLTTSFLFLIFQRLAQRQWDKRKGQS
jgi:hypothetical protein